MTTIHRKLLAAAALTAAGIAMLPALGAQAHHPVPVGVAVCDAGVPKVTWTATADLVRGYTWTVNGSEKQPDSEAFTFTTQTTTFTATAKFYSHGQLVAGPESRTGGPLQLRTDCVPPTTTAASTTEAPPSTTINPPTTTTPATAPPSSTSTAPPGTIPTTTLPCDAGETRAEDGSCVPPGFYGATYTVSSDCATGLLTFTFTNPGPQPVWFYVTMTNEPLPVEAPWRFEPESVTDLVFHAPATVTNAATDETHIYEAPAPCAVPSESSIPGSVLTVPPAPNLPDGLLPETGAGDHLAVKATSILLLIGAGSVLMIAARRRQGVE